MPGMMYFMHTYHGFLALQGRGVLHLPREICERYRLDTPGAQLEVTEREDGILELRPVILIPIDQAWFWSKRWQKMEREAERDIEQGRVKRFDSSEDFLADLEEA
jgi:hypothetical protein